MPGIRHLFVIKIQLTEILYLLSVDPVRLLLLLTWGGKVPATGATLIP